MISAPVKRGDPALRQGFRRRQQYVTNLARCQDEEICIGSTGDECIPCGCLAHALMLRFAEPGIQVTSETRRWRNQALALKIPNRRSILYHAIRTPAVSSRGAMSNMRM